MGSVLHPYILELNDWPLVALRAPRGVDPEAIDQDSFYAITDRLLVGPPVRGDGRFALLHDYRGAGPLSPKRRKRMVDYLHAHNASIRARVIAYAALTESPLQRGFFTAVQWIYNAPCPLHGAGTESEARAWLESEIRAGRAPRLAAR